MYLYPGTPSLAMKPVLQRLFRLGIEKAHGRAAARCIEIRFAPTNGTRYRVVIASVSGRQSCSLRATVTPYQTASFLRSRRRSLPRRQRLTIINDRQLRSSSLTGIARKTKTKRNASANRSRKMAKNDAWTAPLIERSRESAETTNEITLGCWEKRNIFNNHYILISLKSWNNLCGAICAAISSSKQFVH